MEKRASRSTTPLNLSLEKRYANKWSGRISYSLSKADGTANDQADKNLYQVGQTSTWTFGADPAT